MTGWSRFSDYIEDFCITRFQSNASKGRAALDDVLDRIYDETRGHIAEMLRDATGVPLHVEEKKVEGIDAKDTKIVFIN